MLIRKLIVFLAVSLLSARTNTVAGGLKKPYERDDEFLLSTSKFDNEPETLTTLENQVMEKEFLKLLDIDPSKYSNQSFIKTPPLYIENIYKAMSSMKTNTNEALDSGSLAERINSYPTARALFTRKDHFYSLRHFLVFNIKQINSKANLTGAELVIPEVGMNTRRGFRVSSVIPHHDNYMRAWDIDATGDIGQVVFNVTEYLILCVSKNWRRAVFRIDSSKTQKEKFMKAINKESILVIYENVDVGQLKGKLSRMKRETYQNSFQRENANDQRYEINDQRYETDGNVSKTTLDKHPEYANSTESETDVVRLTESLPLSTTEIVTTETSNSSGIYNESYSPSTDTPIELTNGSHIPAIHCKLHRWTFHFSFVKWARFIVHPEKFDAGYCKGLCLSPFVQKNMNSTNYSFLKNLYHIMTHFEDRDVPQASCTPISYYPQTVQYQLPNGEYITRTLADMRVAACGCR